MASDPLHFKIPDEIAQLIPEDKLAAVIELFASIDSNNDGKVSLEEYLNFALSEEKMRLRRAFEALDRDRDGNLNFSEFVAAAVPNLDILKLCREFDRDANGLLSVEEAIRTTERLQLSVDSVKLRSLLADVDRDGDGQITYFEYLGAIAHVNSQS
ncbi:MAG: EF-hand domain-containing protein [Cyanobacteria bacterium J06648_11]